MTYSRILGTGSYLPARILPNADLEKLVETNDQLIVERTGIRERHIAAEGEFTSDLATQAARAALEVAGLAPDDIDLLLVATTTPDLVFPSTACIVQSKLGMTNGKPAFDLQAVCSGFVYALATAYNFIRAGTHKRALVVGSEVFSRIVDWNDRGTCVLFGDGAGAVVLAADAKPGLHASVLHADGSHAGILCVPGNVSGGRILGSPFVRRRSPAAGRWRRLGRR